MLPRKSSPACLAVRGGHVIAVTCHFQEIAIQLEYSHNDQCPVIILGHEGPHTRATRWKELRFLPSCYVTPQVGPDGWVGGLGGHCLLLSPSFYVKWEW